MAYFFGGPAMTIDPLTRAELEHNAATASLMAERRRVEWRAAIPTSTRSLALSREVRRWETQATSWTAVLALVNNTALAPVLDSGSFEAGRRAAEKEYEESWGECQACGRSRHAALNPCTCPVYVPVAPEPLRPTDVCSHLSWNPRDDQEPVTCDDCGYRFTAEELLDRADRCSFCGHPYHGPDT